MKFFRYIHFQPICVWMTDFMSRFWIHLNGIFHSNIEHFDLIKFKQSSKNTIFIANSHLVLFQEQKNLFQAARAMIKTLATMEFGLHGLPAMVHVTEAESETKALLKTIIKEKHVLDSVFWKFPMISTKSLRHVRLKMDGLFGVINNQITVS